MNSKVSKAVGFDATWNGGGTRCPAVLRCFNCLRSGNAKRFVSVGATPNQFKIPGMYAMDRLFSCGTLVLKIEASASWTSQRRSAPPEPRTSSFKFKHMPKIVLGKETPDMDNDARVGEER
jgi:hypothetical protein